MIQNKGSQTIKTTSIKQTNTVETLKDLGNSIAKNTVSDLKNIGLGAFDQFFGNFSEYPQDEEILARQKEQKTSVGQKREFSIFNYQNYYEREIVKKQIKELTEQIKKEISLIKKADTALAADLKDIEKLTIDSLPEKPGIYHIRFLEIILRILTSLREKIGESRTWLSAMVTRRKKRGSLFMVLSKKKGTQYSLSQELSTARSIQ